DMVGELDKALASAPSVRDVVVVTNMGTPTTTVTSAPHVRVTDWDTVSDPARAPHQFQAFPTSQTLMLGYTSGTTGKPKGAVHTHAGFTTKVATEVAYSFDIRPGDTFCWITDMGWVMGPLSALGAHANGAALLLYEGSPDI